MVDFEPLGELFGLGRLEADLAPIWIGKQKDPLLDYEGNSADEMTELFPLQKWSISNLWEHFLVSENSRPIWLRSDGLTDEVWVLEVHLSLL